MCRLAAYLGPPIQLSNIVIDPEHSLLEQSLSATEAKIAVQGDGFGFSWYDEAHGPGLYRDVLPAWSDGNLPSLCHMIRSNLFLAHVRASTSGETSRVNCHPFRHEKWSFMHNGQIGDIAAIRRPLEALLCDELYDARRGTTDSELVFLLLLNYGLREDPVQAVRIVLQQLKKYSAYGKREKAVRLTCVFSEGTNIYCFRHASDAIAPTLYCKHQNDGSWVLASEPLDADLTQWTEAPTDHLLTISKGADSFISTPLQAPIN